MRMPVLETYRGVGIHDFQPTERIDTVVKPAIDQVLALDGINELLAIAGDTYRPPADQCSPGQSRGPPGPSPSPRLARADHVRVS